MDHDTNHEEVEENVEDEIGSFYGMNEGTIDFLDLPIDIIYILFELFDNTDLMAVRKVCRGWNATYWSLISSFDWRMFAKEKFDGNMLYSLAKRFGGLKRVDLSNCELIPTVTIIDALSSVPGLTALNLAGTKVNSTEMVEALDLLPRIRQLNLSHTAINDRVMAKICNLYGPTLRELRIDSCQVLLDTSPLDQLRGLEILSLRQCRKIVAPAMQSIKTMTNLRELCLVNNSNITSLMVSEVLTSLKELQILELGFYDLTPQLLDAIMNRRPLQSLTIHQLYKIDSAKILRILSKIKNYTHKGLTMDQKLIKEIMEDLPSNLQHVHFEGMDGPRELTFTIGPATASELPIALNYRSRSTEFKQLLSRIKKPFWKLRFNLLDDYGRITDIEYK